MTLWKGNAFFENHWKAIVPAGNLVSSLLTKLSSHEEREWKSSGIVG
jgi:hypothetical protein